MTTSNSKPVAFSDLELPRAAVLRILKKANSNKMMIGKDPKLALTKSGTLFISYLTATAQEIAAKSGQKTITINHVQAALEAIGFGDWNDSLKKRIEQVQLNKQNKKAQNADEDENDLDVEGKSDAHLMATEEDLDEEEDDESMPIQQDTKEADDDEDVDMEPKRPRLQDLLGASVDPDDDYDSMDF